MSIFENLTGKRSAPAKFARIVTSPAAEPDDDVPVIDAEKLVMLGKLGTPGRPGPQFATVGEREYQLQGEVDDIQGLHGPTVVLRRTLNERGKDGAGVVRRTQHIRAVEVTAGTYKARQDVYDKRDARQAEEKKRANEPHYVDMLAGLEALKGKEPSITPLSPELPGEKVFGATLRERRTPLLVQEPESPRRGIEGAWDYLTATRGIKFATTKDGRLDVRTSNLAFADREVIEALGEDVIVAILNAAFPRCGKAHRGEAPMAYTIAAPFRLPLCEQHLKGEQKS